MMVYKFPAAGSLTAECASGAHEPRCKWIETCACECHNDWPRFEALQQLALQTERQLAYLVGQIAELRRDER